MVREMTTSQTEPICVRNSVLQQILLGRRNLFDEEQDHPQLTKDGLIDALLVLYDDCSSDISVKDKNTENFVEKCNAEHMICLFQMFLNSHFYLFTDQPVVTKLRKIRVNVGDFELKKVIGQGQFGKVHLVKEKPTGNVYAMKIMKKKDTLEKQNVRQVLQMSVSNYLLFLIHCRLHFMKKKRMLWPKQNQSG